VIEPAIRFERANLVQQAVGFGDGARVHVARFRSEAQVHGDNRQPAAAHALDALDALDAEELLLFGQRNLWPVLREAPTVRRCPGRAC
jgi:hypothetical protein